MGLTSNHDACKHGGGVRINQGDTKRIVHRHPPSRKDDGVSSRCDHSQPFIIHSLGAAALTACGAHTLGIWHTDAHLWLCGLHDMLHSQTLFPPSTFFSATAFISTPSGTDKTTRSSQP